MRTSKESANARLEFRGAKDVASMDRFEITIRDLKRWARRSTLYALCLPSYACAGYSLPNETRTYHRKPFASLSIAAIGLKRPTVASEPNVQVRSTSARAVLPNTRGPIANRGVRVPIVRPPKHDGGRTNANVPAPTRNGAVVLGPRRWRSDINVDNGPTARRRAATRGEHGCEKHHEQGRTTLRLILPQSSTRNHTFG
jgi:hypothetical protein